MSSFVNPGEAMKNNENKTTLNDIKILAQYFRKIFFITFSPPKFSGELNCSAKKPSFDIYQINLTALSSIFSGNSSTCPASGIFYNIGLIH